MIMLVEESHLTKCFEMLIERLDAVESSCENIQKTLEFEQHNKVGFINTLAWGLDVDLYVHDPLYPNRLGPFGRPYAFLVKTNWHDVEWGYRLSLQEALDGSFDDDLYGKCDVDLTKKLLAEEEETRVAPKCQAVGLKSSRVFVLDYLGDIQISRWLTKQTKKIFKTVHCNWNADDGVSFWLTPKNDEEVYYRTRKTNIRECVESVINLLRDLGGPVGRLEFQVCPVTCQSLQFFKTYEVVSERTEWNVEDDITREGKEYLKSSFRRGFMKTVEKHSLLGDMVSAEAISEW